MMQYPTSRRYNVIEAVVVGTIIGFIAFLCWTFLFYHDEVRETTVVSFSWKRTSENQAYMLVERRVLEVPEGATVLGESLGRCDYEAQDQQLCTYYTVLTWDWEPVQYHKAFNLDQDPRWPNPVIPANNRLEPTSETYTVHLIDGKGRVHDLKVKDEAEWYTYQIGQTVWLDFDRHGWLKGPHQED